MDVAEIPEQLEVEEPLTEQEQGQEHKPRLEKEYQHVRQLVESRLVQTKQRTEQQLKQEHKQQPRNE